MLVYSHLVLTHAKNELAKRGATALIPLLPRLFDILVPEHRFEVLKLLSEVVNGLAGDLDGWQKAVWCIRVGRQPEDVETQRSYSRIVNLPLWRILLIRLVERAMAWREKALRFLKI